MLKYFSYSLTILLISIGNLLVDNDSIKSYGVFSKIRFLYYWIIVFTSVCLLNLIDPFITLWLGSDYLLPKIVLISLVLNYFQSMMLIVYNMFKEGAGIWVEDRIIPIIQAILNLLISLLLLYYIGLSGIFFGTLISSLVIWIYTYPKYVFKRLFNKSYYEYFINFIKSILLFIFINFVTYLIVQMINIDNDLLELIVKLIICLIIPNVILLIIYRKSKEFKYYKELVINKIKR